MEWLRPLAELQALFRSSKAFRQVFLSDLVSQLGDGGLTVAFPLLILEKTHDLTLTGLAFSGEILAFAILSPIAGYWADKLKQKRVMIAANAARISLMGLMLVVLALGAPMGVPLVLSLAIGATGAFFVPAQSVFLIRLLDGPELEKAIAVEWTAGFLTRMIGPPLMGVLLLFLPASTGIAMDMVAYGLAIAFLAPRYVRGREGVLEGSEDQVDLGGWREGWRIVVGSQALLGLLVLDAMASMVGFAGFSTTVAFLEKQLHVGAQSNGWLMAMTGLAGALGSQLTLRMGNQPRVYLGLVGVLSVSYLLVPFAATLPVLMVIWGLRGLALGSFGVLLSQRLALTVPKEAMGRVNAAWILAICLAAFVGSAMTPVLLRVVGPAASFTLFGVTLALVATLGAAILSLKPIDSGLKVLQ